MYDDTYEGLECGNEIPYIPAYDFDDDWYYLEHRKYWTTVKEVKTRIKVTHALGLELDYNQVY